MQNIPVIVTLDTEGIPVPRLVIDPHDKQVLLKAHSDLMHNLSAAHRWYDDPAVPAKDKEAYWLTLFNMRDRQFFMYKLLRACGCPEDEIMQDLDLPF